MNSFGISENIIQKMLFVKAKMPAHLLKFFEPANCGTCYVCKMVEVFREVRRVLRKDGTVWLNLGDSYVSGKSRYSSKPQTISGLKDRGDKLENIRPDLYGHKTLKDKDLCGIPWLVAFALQKDGWWLRQDIIWCLSGGTWLYIKTQDSGITIMTTKDLYRLKKENIRLWNGKEWTQLTGMSKSKRQGVELEIVLRSGERITCTPAHKWRSSKGLVEASSLRIGDYLFSCQLPEPLYPKDTDVIGEDVAWLCGLYLAEGSMADDTIQIAGHSKEENRWLRVEKIARRYGGMATRTISGNKMDIRIYGKILNALIKQFISGRTAKDKCFSPAFWRYSNKFIENAIMGYLQGDGHYEDKNNRWRLGFCRNYNLERDLRAACARLGWHIVLNLATTSCGGKKFSSFRGEIRTQRSGHWNEKSPLEIVEIKNARCRDVYDIGVADEPHEFALASGVLTHNSKPNPMPESVTDRCTKSHEYIFMLTKSANYYYDNEAIKENSVNDESYIGMRFRNIKQINVQNGYPGGAHDNLHKIPIGKTYEKRNRRDVWTVPVYTNSVSNEKIHFAVFSEELITPCILAGCPKNGIAADIFMGTGTTGVAAKKNNCGFVGIELRKEFYDIAEKRINSTEWGLPFGD